MSKTFHGWFSQAAVDAGFGSSMYATNDGRTVEVTCVSIGRDWKGYVWVDKVYVGLVTRFVRSGAPNTQSSPLLLPPPGAWA
jgi:hypothetical protein